MMAMHTHKPASALPVDGPVGILGAGTMGIGIAQVAARAAHPVLLYDNCPGTADAALRNLAASLEKQVERGRLEASEAAAIQARLQAVDTLSALAPCVLVIEAIVENLEVKRAVFRELETHLGEQTILASNTSSISITALGANLRRPGRLAGMHFFNPAPAMQLVEIVRGLASAPEVVECLYATAVAWGKIPVHARSTPGFIVNRLARPYYGEALRLLQEQVADYATIDAILREAGAFRMGPFELMDLIGHDVNFSVTCSVFDAFHGDPRYTPSLAQGERVAAGMLGRKSGRGFYDYQTVGETEPKKVAPQGLAPQPLPPAIRLYEHGSSLGDGLEQVLTERLRQAGIAFEYADDPGDARLADCAGAVLYRCDGRSATQRAAQSGIADTVLVDLCCDARQATRLAIAQADQAGMQASAAAAGLLQAAGYAVSRIDDAPGMLVMRTVAQLVSEAADAVLHGVCTPEDADLAMCKGVNYPRGPLAWADAIGIGHIVTVLDHLAASYGEDRYRASLLLRRRQWAGQRFFPDRIT